MGMDGLSISNTGVIKEATSADFANKTEQAVHSSAENSNHQVQGLAANQRVHAKDEKEGSNKNKQQQSKEENKEEETFEDGLIEKLEEPSFDESSIEDIDNPNKDFYVKLNVKDDIIELYDSTSDRLIETISGNELGELVQKLNMASGIFVNKKV